MNKRMDNWCSGKDTLLFLSSMVNIENEMTKYDYNHVYKLAKYSTYQFRWITRYILSIGVVI